jgi:hypothetical protein
MGTGRRGNESALLASSFYGILAIEYIGGSLLCVIAAAHVRVVGCRDSILDVVILDCQDIECGVCPPNGDYKLPYCPNCFEMCPVGEEYIVSGLHSEESIFVSNYKKGGLCAPVSVGWQRRVPQCHT